MFNFDETVARAQRLRWQRFKQTILLFLFHFSASFWWEKATLELVASVAALRLPASADRSLCVCYTYTLLIHSYNFLTRTVFRSILFRVRRSFGSFVHQASINRFCIFRFFRQTSQFALFFSISPFANRFVLYPCSAVSTKSVWLLAQTGQITLPEQIWFRSEADLLTLESGLNKSQKAFFCTCRSFLFASSVRFALNAQSPAHCAPFIFFCLSCSLSFSGLTTHCSLRTDKLLLLFFSSFCRFVILFVEFAFVSSNQLFLPVQILCFEATTSPETFVRHFFLSHRTAILWLFVKLRQTAPLTSNFVSKPFCTCTIWLIRFAHEIRLIRDPLFSN